MKTQLILAAIGLFAGAASAQTGLIAHKSHSGTATTFAMADPGNFGGPAIMPRLERKLEKFTWINDTTVVMSGRMGYGYFMDTNPTLDDTATLDAVYSDTIYNHPVLSDPNISLDSMKKMYGFYNGRDTPVEFENFEEKVVRTPPKSEKAVDSEKTNVTTPKKKKGSGFLLWIIGGGTFGGILLLSGKRQEKKHLPLNPIGTQL